MSYPSYYDHSGAAGEAITDSTFTPVTVFYDRSGGQYIRQGPYPSQVRLEAGRQALRAGQRRMPEIRIDPLSGHRTIVAGERSRRPGGAPTLSESERAPEPIDPERDPFAEGNEDRTPPELYAVRPGGERARLARLEGARGAQPLPGAGAVARAGAGLRAEQR